MEYPDYAQHKADGFDFGIDSTLTVQAFHAKCAVDELIALKLTSVSPQYAPGSVVPIVGATGTALADLVVCEGQPFEYGRASAHQVAAYLQEITVAHLSVQGEPRRDYVFANNYVVVNVADFADYDQHYRKGSGIWGMFVHFEDQTFPNLPYRGRATQILASPGVEFVGPLLNDLVFRAVAHASPLERFLKLYHLLEIDFDVQMVNAIKSLGADLKGMGKLLKAFSGGNEFDRLLKLVRKASDQVVFFEGILQRIFAESSYHPQLIEMLFEYVKESNPYAKADVTTLPTVFGGGFSVAAMQAAGFSVNYDHLSKFTAYILYRFRCSIAHAKIGEYLITTDDEALICEVAEPAIIAILVNIYKK